MSVLVKKIKSITSFYISLFYGPYFDREELSKRFEKWKKSKDRDEVEKQKLIVDGLRSQDSIYSKQWKWILIQAILWLMISFKFDFSSIINIMAFLTVFTQVTYNMSIIIKDKRQIFNTLIARELISSRTVSNLLWETLSNITEEKELSVNSDKKNFALGFDWTDIRLEILYNKPMDAIPLLRVNIGHDSSKLLTPHDLGLSEYPNQLESSSLIILKLFSRYNPFIFQGHSTQRNSIDKKIKILNDRLILFFGNRDIDPIIKDELSGSWECYINIDDRTQAWSALEKTYNDDINNLLLDWLPIDEEIKHINKKDESYKMKGYDW